ncbi:MAG: Di-trans-poly-cis-decaprenylcistransferase, partial [uncultured bacterium]
QKLHENEKCKMKNVKLNETDFEENLDTYGIPDPDLLIRTGGEKRLSGFLPWQSIYTELYFTDILWPDFSEKDLDEAIEEYQQRNRRFGK